MTRELTSSDRTEGAPWGLLLGDAFAMPARQERDGD